MRAVAVESFEAGPAVLELPVPEPGPGEVLVGVRTASLNGFDVAVASGRLQGMMEHRFPVVLGKDFAGTVEAVGEGVTGFGVGDPVFGALMRGHLGDGTFGEFVVIPVGLGVARIPSGLDPAVAGALGLAGSAALASVEAVAPSPGQTVLVAGATGGVGALVVQLVRARGADVIATAQPGEATAFVTALGASHVVDYTGDLGAQVRSIRPDGVDAAVHLAGDGLQLADLVVSGGRFASTLGLGPDALADRQLHATAVTATPTTDVLDRLAAAAAAGTLRIPVQHTYRLEQVPQAVRDFSNGTLGKLAVTIGES
jgi:NADPH:quinone reductase-like Zn-dependent oxidoreductase